MLCWKPVEATSGRFRLLLQAERFFLQVNLYPEDSVRKEAIARTLSVVCSGHGTRRSQLEHPYRVRVLEQEQGSGRKEVSMEMRKTVVGMAAMEFHEPSLEASKLNA